MSRRNKAHGSWPSHLPSVAEAERRVNALSRLPLSLGPYFYECTLLHKTVGIPSLRKGFSSMEHLHRGNLYIDSGSLVWAVTSRKDPPASFYGAGKERTVWRIHGPSKIKKQICITVMRGYVIWVRLFPAAYLRLLDHPQAQNRSVSLLFYIHSKTLLDQEALKAWQALGAK